MKSKKIPKPPDKGSSLLQYIGLGSQLMAALGLSVYIGIRADKKLKSETPLLVWILPLLVICVTIYKLVKETAKPNNGKEPSGS
ncbi:AtpZ/AtpI family protein [Flavihumibacter stibioxidans]|uniref:F0F1-ATPase subunit Ca2+/Mg2+ transporter n=1 Tax=Flavihumibacter stibioxidans TaxID=1834163 RepID=A0ABR7MC95_9BACT|nr:hypothetical protein [Flavihumibacter stibioxidans]